MTTDCKHYTRHDMSESGEEMEKNRNKINKVTMEHKDQSKTVHVDVRNSEETNASVQKKDNVTLEEAISSFTLKSKDQWREMDARICEFFRMMVPSPMVYSFVFGFLNGMRTKLMLSMPRATLHIYGHIVSRIPSHSKYINISFQHEGVNEPENTDFVKILQSFTNVFSNWRFDPVCPETRSVMSSAKHNPSGRNITITCYATLRVYLSQLLAKYCEWDFRVSPLGVFIQNWAKGLKDRRIAMQTTPGYIWLIMMVHYLQNCEPPVLPRLQEDFASPETKPEFVFQRGAAANVYFHKDVLRGWSKNTKMVAELFFGFLDYFANFDYKNEVAQIRRKLPLHKLEKNWIHVPFCVENPFKPDTVPRDKFDAEHMTVGPVSAFKLFKSCKLNYVPEKIPSCPECGCVSLCTDECPKNAERYALYFESRLRFGAPLRPKDLLLYNKRNTTKPVPDEETIMKTFEESLKRRM